VGARNKGYCGPCVRREKVAGLEFVRCCFMTEAEGGGGLVKCVCLRTCARLGGRAPAQWSPTYSVWCRSQHVHVV
jgi:hypothetical protein